MDDTSCSGYPSSSGPYLSSSSREPSNFAPQLSSFPWDLSSFMPHLSDSSGYPSSFTPQLSSSLGYPSNFTPHLSDSSGGLSILGLMSIKWTRKIERFFTTALWLVCSFYRRPPKWSPSIKRPLSGF